MSSQLEINVLSNQNKRERERDTSMVVVSLFALFSTRTFPRSEWLETSCRFDVIASRSCYFSLSEKFTTHKNEKFPVALKQNGNFLMKTKPVILFRRAIDDF